MVCLIFYGHLSGQTGKTTRTGLSNAKSVCYRTRFWGWARGPGVLWAKNQPRRVMEVGDHPSVVHLIFHGHLGGTTGKTVQRVHF